MAKKIKTKSGKTMTLLSPREKGNKYACELQGNYPLTNDGKYKMDKDGIVQPLSDTQKAYRSGYLDARKDIGKAYASIKNKKH